MDRRMRFTVLPRFTSFSAGALSAHSASKPTVVSRKRPSTVDVRLNTAQHPSVPSCLDRSIHRDERVLENLLIAEENLKSNHLYFTAVQEHIEPIHREQAVEWIFDVAKEEKCDADVFPLAVSLIDRFLSLQNIFRQDIQVLAGVCLFIASKVKAPQPMNAARVSYYTADSVKVHDVLSWELLVLANLNWEITSPTGFDFFDHLSARLPSLHTLRPAFTSVLHRIQRCKFWFCSLDQAFLGKQSYLSTRIDDLSKGRLARNMCAFSSALLPFLPNL
ncbi:cyclin domain protein [Ostertagia ostertagi]